MDTRFRSRRWTAVACAAVAVLAASPGAQARTVSAGKDGRPNILVVMTDDQALTDVAQMPNVRHLLADQGTTFADAVDSFPLCCPSRATYLSGQYAQRTPFANTTTAGQSTTIPYVGNGVCP